MKLTLESLIVLDSIARRGSFAAAANELYRSASTITYTIQKLEESLQVTLFDRTGHRAKLTDEGAYLLDQGRNLLQLAEKTERQLSRLATGWESELRIAVGDMVPMQSMLELAEEFFNIAPETQLHLSQEVLGGTWDALFSERADLVIGAPDEGPSGGGYSQRLLGDADFLFVVAPDHPLASAKEPLNSQQIRRHRIVAAADSSRGLPPRSHGLLSGQSVFTVPNLEIKRRAQLMGLGVGYLPRTMITWDLEQGLLIEKRTEVGDSTPFRLWYAWHTENQGKGLSWFIEQLEIGRLSIEWLS